MKNKYFLIVIIFGIIVLSSINVMAFMPRYTHQWLMDSSLLNPIQTQWYNACIKYPDLCYSANVCTDSTVVHYYFGSNKYVATHSPQFCSDAVSNALNYFSGENQTRMLACSVGFCLHGEQDLASHGPGGMVQYTITHSFLINSISHVFAEQHLDNILQSQHPELDNRFASTNFLQSADACKPLYVMTLAGQGAYSGVSTDTISNEYEQLKNEVQAYEGGVYDPAFQSKSFLGTFGELPWYFDAGWIAIMAIFGLICFVLILKILKRQAVIRTWIGLIIFGIFLILLIWLFINALNSSIFSALILIIKPLSNFMPIGNYQTYLNMGIQNSISFFNNGPIDLQGKDPSGVATNPVLLNADKQISYVDYIILIGIAILFLWFAWYVLKKNKALPKPFQNFGGSYF